MDLLRFSLLGTGTPTLMLLEGLAFGVFTMVCLVLRCVLLTVRHKMPEISAQRRSSNLTGF